jgi:YidC/Oxa1 family membrane protein insertase
LGLLAFIIVRFFFSPKATDYKGLEGRVDSSGQIFRAPVSQLETRPLNKEIDFVDDKSPETDQEIFIETSFCEYSFSANGGVLSGIDFKKYKGGSGDSLRTVYKRSFEEREQGCFLLALDEKTPYAYKLVDSNSSDGKHTVSFETEGMGWIIRKSYEVSDDSYDIKFSCEFRPKKSTANPIRPRFFVAGPFSGSVVGDKIDGILSGVNKEEVKQVTTTEEGDFGWKLPTIFGSQDRYFLHALYKVSDDSFVERAYYKRLSESGLFSIFECRELSQASSVEMTFYFGPKIVSDLTAADVRLNSVLDFGWFSTLCKWLLMLLASLFDVLGSYGWAIVLLALLIKLPFLPLTLLARRKAAAVTAFEQKHAGTIQSINMRYKSDFVKRGEAIAKFYAEHGISQMAKMAGMLPLLLQVPFFIALYRGLSSYLVLYQVQFGWVSDLSAKDPYYILPVILGILTIAQQKSAPVTDTRAKMMAYVPAVLIVALMASFPAGAVLFWTSNTLFMLCEEMVMRRIFGAVKL